MEEKLVYRVEDIKERYGVGRSKALEIIRAIKQLTRADKLGCGAVLYSEVVYWENYIPGKEQNERRFN